MLDERKRSSLKRVLSLIEKVVDRRKLPRSHHRDEVEKYLNFVLQGRDMINPYERRNADVLDEEWEDAVSIFRADFGTVKLEGKENEGPVDS